MEMDEWVNKQEPKEKRDYVEQGVAEKHQESTKNIDYLEQGAAEADIQVNYHQQSSKVETDHVVQHPPRNNNTSADRVNEDNGVDRKWEVNDVERKWVEHINKTCHQLGYKPPSQDKWRQMMQTILVNDRTKVKSLQTIELDMGVGV